MKTVTKILLRVISLPFVAAIIGIAAIRNYFYTLYLWLANGGELTVHDDTFNPVTLRDQFDELRTLLKNKPDNNNEANSEASVNPPRES